jgi:hypothetical protein
LTSGTIVRAETHPFEREDVATRDLPRIALHFNRRDSARLRELIDMLNRDG